MENHDLDFIRKFEKIENRRISKTMGILSLFALLFIPIYIFWDILVSETGTVEVTLSYFMRKFSYGALISFVICFSLYIGMRKKYKKLKEKE